MPSQIVTLIGRLVELSPAMSYPLDVKIIFHVEAIFNFACIALGVLGLVFYCRQNAFANRFGTLPFYIVTTILYGITGGDNNFRQAVGVHGGKISIPIPYSWKVYILIFPPSFTYVSGAMLALDRVLAMLFPFKHGSWHISVKLTCFGLFVCLSTALLVCVSNAIVPASFDLYAAWLADTISYKLYQGTHKFYEFVFLAQVILQIVFCIQFHRYLRRQGATAVGHNTQRANQITLFQIITQAVLCLLPKILNYSNILLFGSKIRWIQEYHGYYSFFLSINVLIVNIFIVYRFRPRRRLTVVQSVLTSNVHPSRNFCSPRSN